MGLAYDLRAINLVRQLARYRAGQHYKLIFFCKIFRKKSCIILPNISIEVITRTAWHKRPFLI